MPSDSDINTLPLSQFVGVASMIGKVSDRGRKCLLWKLWLASIRKRMATIKAAHTFFLSNMAGRMGQGRVCYSVNYSASDFNMLVWHHLGLCCYIHSWPSFISMISCLIVNFELIWAGSVVRNKEKIFKKNNGTNLVAKIVFHAIHISKKIKTVSSF